MATRRRAETEAISKMRAESETATKYTRINVSVSLAAISRAWRSREGAHALATLRAVRSAVRLRNRALTSADAGRAISGRGHACHALLADSCRVRQGSGCERRWRSQRPTL